MVTRDCVCYEPWMSGYDHGSSSRSPMYAKRRASSCSNSSQHHSGSDCSFTYHCSKVLWWVFFLHLKAFRQQELSQFLQSITWRVKSRKSVYICIALRWEQKSKKSKFADKMGLDLTCFSTFEKQVKDGTESELTK